MTDRRLPWSSFAGPADISEQTISAIPFEDDDDPLPIIITSTPPSSGGTYTTTRVVRGIAHPRDGATFAVALKVFAAWTLLDVTHMVLIRREVLASRRARHRFILPYIGTAEHGFHSILISPFMEKGNLQQYLSTCGMNSCQTLILQVATAVVYLHSVVGLVHGDLKCENVLVSDAGNALLADFGLATLVEMDDSSISTVTAIRLRHTVQFSAPELLLDAVIQESPQSGNTRLRSKSTHTDVYAFGMLLLQAFSGQPPWPDYSPMGVIKQVCARVVHPRPDSHGPFQLTDPWWTVCLRCWAYNPLERPTMHEVLQELRRSAGPEALARFKESLVPEGETCHGHTSAVFSVAYMPCGTRVVSGSWDRSVRIWDICTHECVVGPLVGHTGPIRCVAASPDGQEVASCGDDCTVRRWSTSGHLMAEPMAAHFGCVNFIAYSPDGTLLVSGSDDMTVRMWRLRNSAEPTGTAKILLGHDTPVMCVAFSPDGSCFASGSRQGPICLWRSSDGQQLVRFAVNNLAPVQSLSFSLEGELFVSTFQHKFVHIWAADNPHFEWRMSGHSELVRAVAISPSGQYLASASDDKTIRIWDARTGCLVGEPLREHTGFVKCVKFSPCGKYLVSGSWDTTVRVWNLSRIEGFNAPSPGRDSVMAAFPVAPSHSSGDNLFRRAGRFFNLLSSCFY